MKKIVVIYLLSFFILAVCSTGIINKESSSKPADNKSIEISADLSTTDLGNIQYTGLKYNPVKASNKDIKESSTLELLEMEVISGQKNWNDFLSKVEKKEAASISISEYYETGDRGEKLDKPVLYVKKLDFDGKKYRLSYYDEGKLYQYSYSYLIEKIGLISSNAAFATHGFYLINNKDVSFHDLCWSLISSNFSDQIDYKRVYEEKIDKKIYLSCKPGTYRTKDGAVSVSLDENCRFQISAKSKVNDTYNGRYYYEGHKLILKVSNKEKYTFQITDGGKLICKSSKNSKELISKGMKLIYQ